MSDDWLEKYPAQMRQLEKMLQSQRHLQKMITLLEPQRRMQEQLDKLLEPRRRMQEQLDKLLEPQRRMQEQLDKLLEPQRRMQEQLDKLLEPRRRMQEQLDKLLEPQRRIQEQLDKLLEPRRRMQEQLDNLLRYQGKFKEDLIKWKQPLEIENYITDILSQTEYGNITINQSGAIAVAGNTFSANELSDIYNKLFDSIENISSPGQVLNVIWTFLQKLKEPITILLLIVILPFIINVASNLSTSYFEDIISEMGHTTKREQIKAIRQEAKQDFAPDLLKEYRFVGTNILNVRKGPSTKDQVINKIYLGQVVHLVTKGRQWSSIEYTDEDTDEIFMGWVFTRYLFNFKK